MKIPSENNTYIEVPGIYYYNDKYYDKYTTNDIVLYEGKLYVVIADTSNIDHDTYQNPAMADSANEYYKEYIRQLSITNLSQLVDTPINDRLYLPINMMDYIFNQYIQGINILGTVQYLHEGDFDDIVNTSVYFILSSEILDNLSRFQNYPIDLLTFNTPSNDEIGMHLFRAYTEGKYTIQEWYDIYNNVVYHRELNLGTHIWNSWSRLYGSNSTAINNTSNILSIANNIMSQYITKVNDTYCNYASYFTFLKFEGLEDTSSSDNGWSKDNTNNINATNQNILGNFEDQAILRFNPSNLMNGEDIFEFKFIIKYDQDNDDEFIQDIISIYLPNNTIGEQYIRTSTITPGFYITGSIDLATNNRVFMMKYNNNSTLTNIQLIAILGNTKKKFIEE